MLNVWNENLIVLKWQTIHIISGITFTEIYNTKSVQAVYFTFRKSLTPHSLT